MLKVRTTALVAALSAFLAIAPVSPATAYSSSRLEQTRREIRATRARLSSALRTDAELSAALSLLTSRLNRERHHLSLARGKLSRLDFQISQYQQRLTRLERERKKRGAIIAGRARALYIAGPVTSFQTIVEARSLEEFVGRAAALDSVAMFDRTVLEDLGRISHEAKQERAQLREARARALSSARDVAARVSVVAEATGAQREARGIVQGRIAAYRKELQAELAEQNRILQLIRQRSGYYSGSMNTGPPGRMGFAWPTRGRSITSPYGSRHGSFHTGMDIDCRTGDPIAASKAGRVIASEWGGGYGNMVIIDHGSGYTTLYGHMSRSYTREGATVDQHQLVGACGSTGNSTGDHLHFEVRINGNHRNPRPYLP
ncbi:MAG: peptidoglycan DD-metalloendopeptidase family protein [Actinomycetota bacterium]